MWPLIFCVYYLCRISSFQWMPNCDFSNHTILTVTKTTGTSLTNVPCGEACFYNPNCTHFSLDINRNICSLKKATAGMKSVRSPNKLCGLVNRFSRQWNVSADGSYQWAKDCYFNGGDIAINKSISGYSTCASACKIKSNCNYFTFSSKFSTCFLKLVTGFFAEKNNTKGAVCGFIPERQQVMVESITTATISPI